MSTYRTSGWVALALAASLAAQGSDGGKSAAKSEPQGAQGETSAIKRVDPEDQGKANQLERVVVEGRQDSMIGIADSATEGVIGREQILKRPLLRNGEVLETIPGLIATQHSGTGKGNQFFLRGFNLDHGTDLAVRVGGIPINMPSHGHGQGYVDLNFLIPELIDTVSFRKGPYRARDGNFGSAGAVDINYVRSLDKGYARVTGGSFGWLRSVFADSIELEDGDLLVGVEANHFDGPWDVAENFVRFNGVIRYTTGDEADGWSVTAMGYDSRWTANDHIPRRAVENGTLNRFGSLDPTTGGEAQRYSLRGEWHTSDDHSFASVSGYGFFQDLDLFSNFTYFLDDPVNGDQFEQVDRRVTFGIDSEYTRIGGLGDLDTESTIGINFRQDFIDNGLHKTVRRQRLSTTRDDSISESLLGLWVENRTRWNDWFRTTVGARGDFIFFDVDSDLAANSGTENDALFSPKAGVAFGPWASTEFYINGGYGYHSNDARGATLRDDPTTAAPNDGVAVTPLVRSRGLEGGFRSSAIDGLQSTLALFVLDLDSELVFVGDAGATEPSDASRRIGVEWENYWQLTDWLSVDLDATFTRARFRGANNGARIPNAIESTIAAGITAQSESGLYGSLRLRNFGTRPLTEDNSVRARVLTLVNLRAGYQFQENNAFFVDVLNLFDEDDNDIEYFYTSRVQGEPAGGVDDVHFSPVQPIGVRITFETRF